MYNKTKKYFITLITAFVCIFLLSSCSAQKSSADVFEKAQGPVTVTAVKKNTAFSTSTAPQAKLKSILRKGLTTLYLDESSFSVCVFDGASGKLWRSLPESESKENACLFSVSVLCGSREYILDSQNDSAALNNFQYKEENGVLTMIYRFCKQLSESDEADFTIPVRFEVGDGILKVSVNCKNITYGEKNKNVRLKSISLLSHFGADKDTAKGDFILVPDGCGAIISTEKEAEKFTPINVPVYGADPSAKESSDCSACIPAFGKRNGNAAFVALIESGEETAEICAEKALKKGGFNRVYANFDLSKTYNGENNTYVSKNSFDKTLSVSYRFLSGENTDYVSMAAACRELLIRCGALRMDERTLPESEGLPFELAVVGSAKPQNRKRQTVLTSMSEAADIISFLRSKGIRNINLRYRGLFEGGLVQNNFEKIKLFSPVGTEKELEDFARFAQSQNVSVFAEAGLFSAGKENSAAIRIDGGRTEKAELLLDSGFTRSSADLRFSPAKTVEKNTENLLSSMRDLSVDGICVADAGKFLYSDYSANLSGDRSFFKNLFASRCGALSSGKKLMVSGANLYAVKYASFLSEIPSTANCAKQKLCTAVPFLQSVLHGSVDYSHSAFNKASDRETAFLKAAEYGAVPGFELYSENSGTDDEKDEFYYMNDASDAQQYYERLNIVFSDLRNKRITAHKKVAGGVYCTEYGSSSSVYVNYNKKDVTVNGVTVEARSFLRINF